MNTGANYCVVVYRRSLPWVERVYVQIIAYNHTLSEQVFSDKNIL